MHVSPFGQTQFWTEMRMVFDWEISPLSNAPWHRSMESCSMRAEKIPRDHLVHPLTFQMIKYRFRELK